MIRLAILALLCAPGVFAGYGYSRTLTIDHTKLGATDATNFGVLVSLTSASLRTLGNGGHVTSSSGYDVVFFSDAALTTRLDFEIETYSATTGAIVMWVRVPTISHTVDTAIYMGYGNAAIVASQENKTGVWDTNFVAVYHLSDGTTLNAADSTASALNGTIAGALPVTGQIDGAASFNGGTDRITATGGNFSGNVTMDVWVNPVEFNYGGLVESSAAGTYSRDYAMVLSNGGSTMYMFVGGGLVLMSLSSPIVINVWNHVVATADGTNWKVYLNGALVSTAANAGLPASAGGVIYLGVEGGGADQLRGSLDEVRVSKTVRSADWILAEYNNQSSPGTFTTLGAEVPVNPVVPRAVVRAIFFP